MVSPGPVSVPAFRFGVVLYPPDAVCPGLSACPVHGQSLVSLPVGRAKQELPVSPVWGRHPPSTWRRGASLRTRLRVQQPSAFLPCLEHVFPQIRFQIQSEFQQHGSRFLQAFLFRFQPRVPEGSGSDCSPLGGVQEHPWTLPWRRRPEGPGGPDDPQTALSVAGGSQLPCCRVDGSCFSLSLQSSAVIVYFESVGETQACVIP